MRIHQTTRLFLLTLLTWLMSTAWAVADDSSSRKITVTPTVDGSIMANLTQATPGATVTLTVTPTPGYKLVGGSLVVEKIVDTMQANSGSLTRQGTPQVGGFVGTVKTAATTYTFIMPETDVEVSGLFAPSMVAPVDASQNDDSSQAVGGVEMEVIVTSEADKAVVIDEVTLPANAGETALSVIIPAQVTAANGQSYTVSRIAPDAFFGLTNVTDVYLPDTGSALQISENAFHVDNNSDDTHHVIRIHTPLNLLDDYALLTALKENYAESKIQATATVPHQYWTFSCGVDVILPNGVSFYICKQNADGAIVIEEVKGQQVIKANNGVLLACADNNGHSYEMVASPSSDRPSGVTPATYDAKTYSGNLLEPVIEGRHYDRGGFYVLYDNEFHQILQEGASAQIPACKAVLNIKK